MYFFLTLRDNSSLPNIFEKIDTGVNIKKYINAKINGLTIFPKSKPNLNQIKFGKYKISDFIKVINKINNEIDSTKNAKIFLLK